ncbi:hypothetical protein GmHk_09G025232 [Glycine max]|nr:hypothetical protein GmHk_09G025232 [Glycine max]
MYYPYCRCLLPVMMFCIGIDLLCMILVLVVIMRSDTCTEIRGRTSFVLIGCERNGKYRVRKKYLVRTITDNRKCGCPFKLQAKLVVGVGHPYVDRLTKDEKIIIVDMTKSMVKPRNILLTLKEHNANNYTTM